MRNAIMALLGLTGVALLVLVFLLPKATTGPAKSNKPNVVFILVDTLRADRVFAERNGIPVMPKLAALARQGRTFTHAISPASWTRPSIASLITGQYVDTHEVYFGVSKDETGRVFADALSERWKTLAETLQEAGYATWAYVTNGNIQADGFEQGYKPEDYHFVSEAPAATVSSATLEHLPSAGAPFFLYVHYLDPHAPYDPPEPYRSLFGPTPDLTEPDRIALKNEAQIPYLQCVVHELLGSGMARKFAPMSEGGKETMRIWYDGECRYVDDQVSRVVEAVRTQHPNTLFVITSDHGEEFWEHEGMGHGTTLYEEQIRVPLVLFGPGIAPAMIEESAENIGIYRTILAYLGLSASIPPRGANLLEDLPVPAAAYARTKGPSTDIEVDLDAAVASKVKVIRDLRKASVLSFDLGGDPGERQPLAEDTRGVALSRALDEHRAGNLAVKPPLIERVQVEVPADILEFQRRAGYADKDGEAASAQP